MDSLPIPGIDHLVLDTVDLERALGFYALLPGARTSRDPGRGVVNIGRQKLNIHIFPPHAFTVGGQPRAGRPGI